MHILKDFVRVREGSRERPVAIPTSNGHGKATLAQQCWNKVCDRLHLGMDSAIDLGFFLCKGFNSMHVDAIDMILKVVDS